MGRLRRKSLICRRFTLVEILAVLAILAMLMGIGVGVYSLTMSKAKRAKTEALIKRIEVALEAFKTKYGYYPQTEAVGNNHFYLDLDNKQGTSPSWDNTDGSLTYFKKLIDYESINNSAVILFGVSNNKIIVDAWGFPIYYKCPGAKNTGSFDLASPGPDGKAGSNTVTLWYASGANKNKLQDATAPAPAFDSKTSDDITNF